MNLIGINGFKRAGKGEVAAAVLRNAAGLTEDTGFANALKVLGAYSLGFDREADELVDLANSLKIDATITVEYHEPPRTNAEPYVHEQSGRGYYQELGTRGRQVLGDDVWVDLVLPRPASFQDVPFEDGLRKGAEKFANKTSLFKRYPGVDTLTISDLRFENEAERVLALGGEVWEVIRPGTGSDGHASEQVLPRELVSRQIINDGDLALLDSRVQEALAAL